MVSLYLGSFLFGGVLLAATLATGHGGDHGGGHGGGHGSGHAGPSHSGGQDGDQVVPSLLLPVMSLRFWTFALAFFGLTGLVLTGVGAASSTSRPVLSGLVGFGTGYLASHLLRRLVRRSVGVVPTAESHVGREGQLLLPVSPGQPGKIRLSIGGATTDMVAITDSGHLLPPGSTVLVVGMRGSVAVVEPNPALPSPDSSS